MADVVKLLVANSALLEAPILETHHRGANWMAVIDINATMPGGLDRRFLPRGRGECLCLITQLALFDAIEFGADYTTSVGTKRRNRWYGVVTAITDGYIMVERCASGAKAVLRAKDARASLKERKAAVQAERDALIERVTLLNGEIEELETEDVVETTSGES